MAEACPVCPEHRSEIEFLRKQLGLLQDQLVALSDPMAYARVSATQNPPPKQETTPKAPRSRDMAPADRPTEAEIKAVLKAEAPAEPAPARDIEAEFRAEG